MSDGPDHLSDEQFEDAQQRNDDMTAEFEHEAAQSCEALAMDLTHTIDLYGLERVRLAFESKGYEIKAR